MSFDDYLSKLFNVDYDDMIRRKIEITEWKLGIYNPYSQIDYVDFEDNPHYIGWYTLLDCQRRLYRALQRFGKPTFTAICFKFERQLEERARFEKLNSLLKSKN